jgi:hypothetical protein
MARIILQESTTLMMLNKNLYSEALLIYLV